MTRRERWERAAEGPLTVAALAFLAAYAWPILDPALASPWPTVCRAVTVGTWAPFAVDYLIRLGLSTDRWRFVRTNVLDLATIALPLLRPLRLLRLVSCSTSSTGMPAGPCVDVSRSTSPVPPRSCCLSPRWRLR